MRRTQTLLLAWLGLAILLLIAYSPTLNALPLPWDDDKNIWANPAITNADFWAFWHAPLYGLYIPLTNSLWAVLYKLGGGSSVLFHILNLDLHLLNSILLFQFLRKLSRTEFVVPAFIAAAFFALHPVQVDTVAWISGSRDLLAAAFALGACLLSRESKKWALALFVLGLLCKPSIVALPVFLILIDDQSWSARLKNYTPWILAAFVVSLVTFQAQENAFPAPTPLWWRPVVAMDAYGFYLRQLLWPFNLAVDYGRTPFYLWEHSGELWGTLPFSLLALGMLTWISIRRKTVHFGFGWFAILLPVSGLVIFAFQKISTVADHYQYVPMIAACTVLFFVFQKISRLKMFLFVACLIGGLFIGLDYRRALIWSDEQIFYNDMLFKNPHSLTADIGLGNWEFKQGHFEAARDWYSKAMIERPMDIVAVSNFGAVLFRLEKMQEIVPLSGYLFKPEFIAQMQTNPEPTAALYASLGAAKWTLGQNNPGWQLTCLAVQLQPQNELYRKNLNIMLQQDASKGACPANLTLEAVLPALK